LPSAHDVAEELRRRHPDLGDVKLHKLLYYVQGWQLAATGSPAFREPVEAWVNGPVVADLWADERHQRGRPAPRAVTTETLVIIDYVTRRYGARTGKELIRATHAEHPWRDVSEQEDFATRSPEITHDALRRYFESDDELGTLIDLIGATVDDGNPQFREDAAALRGSPVYTLGAHVDDDAELLAAAQRAGGRTR
jgi:uncharacterized phage-associated protein